MLKFSKLQLGDIDNIKHYFPLSVNMICDNTVGGAFMWRDYFSVEYAEYNETIIFKAILPYRDDMIAFSVPLGKDMRGSVDKIIEYCKATGISINFCMVADDDRLVLESIFPNFEVFREEDWSDYLYTADKMKTLSGRKFSSQRNHINQFIRQYEDYNFEDIKLDNIELVKDFYIDLTSRYLPNTAMAVEDRAKTIEVLDNFEAYGMFGGFISVNDSVVAFSIGEIINNVLFVHIEKADTSYKGSFQVITNEFANRFASSEVEFINREEDVGDAGLRISKLSYHPCKIIDKYLFFVT